MNRALLAELQGLRAIPSITLLHTTEPGASMAHHDRVRIDDLIAEADRRLAAMAEVGDDARSGLITRLGELTEQAARARSTRAVAICVSPEHDAIVRLGRTVDARVVIDETFAARDMVADANRTATFRVVTVSDRLVRLLVGDSSRLVEVDDGLWPLERLEDDSPVMWRQSVNAALHQEQRSFAIPTVYAGVAHTVTDLVSTDLIEPIATLSGNHDATPPPQLHGSIWPLVTEWLQRDGAAAMARLEWARGARLFAGGLDEVWDLARDGRVELLVVEDDFRLSARADGRHLEPIDADPPPSPDASESSFPGDVADAPGVVEDVVDELIETVLGSGGEAVMVPPGELSDYGRLAAVLRY